MSRLGSRIILPMVLAVIALGLFVTADAGIAILEHAGSALSYDLSAIRVCTNDLMSGLGQRLVGKAGALMSRSRLSVAAGQAHAIGEHTLSLAIRCIALRAANEVLAVVQVLIGNGLISPTIMLCKRHGAQAHHHDQAQQHAYNFLHLLVLLSHLFCVCVYFAGYSRG